MKFWPKEFIFRMGREILFGTSFIFTLTVLGDYYISHETVSGNNLLSALAQGLFLSVLMIGMDRDYWKEILASTRMQATKQ
jgi:hypothetical protein